MNARTATTTVSPSDSPATTWVEPPELSPVVISCWLRVPFLSTVTYVFPPLRVTASVGTTSTLLTCL